MKMTTTPSPVSRCSFLGNGAFLGGAFAALLKANEEEVFGAEGAPARILNNGRPDVPYDLVNPENMIYSVCMNCNTGCGIKAKIQDGVLTKIDRSPYNPWALFPHRPMTTTPDDAARVDGALCPKGQAGLQNL